MKQPVSTNKMHVFLIVWFGQLVSLLGSGLTRFALGVWTYQKTGSATQLGLVAFFPEIAIFFISPLAGALVDRWDRRKVMILSDIGAALSTLIVVFLLWSGNIQVWHLYITAAISAICSTFQWPAYTATTALLVPKEHMGRATGMIQLGQAVGQLAAPIIAGSLWQIIGLPGIIAIDFATFLFSVITLALLRFPTPPVTAEGLNSKGSLWKEATYGARYIYRRPGLLGMLVFLAIISFNLGMMQVPLTPLVLSFSTPAVLGTVMSTAGMGMLIGSIIISAWGGPKRRINLVLSFGILQGICLFIIGVQPNTWLILAGVFIFLVGFPIIAGTAEAIWMVKVAPDVQGRVFSTRNMIVASTMPIAFLAAGPLADNLFEPWMQAGGRLSASAGVFLGVGPGRGIGLLFICLGICAALSTAAGLMSSRLRNVEDELPDQVQIADERARDKGPEESSELLPQGALDI